MKNVTVNIDQYSDGNANTNAIIALSTACRAAAEKISQDLERFHLSAILACDGGCEASIAAGEVAPTMPLTTALNVKMRLDRLYSVASVVRGELRDAKETDAYAAVLDVVYTASSLGAHIHCMIDHAVRGE